MVGGIVMNNASGMNCGTHANSDKMLLSVHIIFPDGYYLNTDSQEHVRILKKIIPNSSSASANSATRYAVTRSLAHASATNIQSRT